MGMCGPASAAGGVGVRVPLRRDGRFAKRPYDGVGGNRGCWGRGLVVGGPSTGSGRTESRCARATGWGCRALRRGSGRGRPAPRFLVPVFANGMGECACDGAAGGGPSTGSGRTESRARLRRGVGEGMGEGDAPRRAPALGFPLSRERRWGSAGRRGCWWREALRQAQGERNRGARATGCGGGDGGGRRPAAAPLLDSRFRGNDDVGGRVGGGCWWRRGRVPLRRTGFAVRACDGGRGCDGGLVVGGPSTGSGRTEFAVRACGDDGVSRGRGCGRGLVVGGPSTGSGRTESRCARATGWGGGLRCGRATGCGGRGRRCGEGYSSGRGIQRALKSWG